MEPISAAPVLPDINHPSGDQFAAKNANALVVERLPSAMGVAFAQGPQLIIDRDMLVHREKKSRKDSSRQLEGERNVVWEIFLAVWAKPQARNLP